MYISESGNNVVFCFSRKTFLKLKFRLTLDVNFNFFGFNKNKVEKGSPNNFLRNHAIFWAIFSPQIRFDSRCQLREQLKKGHFSL